MKIIILLAILTISCSRDGDAGKVKVTFSDVTPALALKEFIVPSSFKIRPLHIQLMKVAHGAGGNGENVVIWANTGCKPSKGLVEDGGKTYDWYEPSPCKVSGSDQVIDLAASGAEVNAIFNSQEWEVIPGEFNHASIAFCGIGEHGNQDDKTANIDVNTVLYKAGGMAAEQGMVFCSAWTTPTNGPLVIKEGDSVTIDFSYDLAKLVELTKFNQPLQSKPTSDWCGYNDALTESYCPQLGQDAFTVNIR